MRALLPGSTVTIRTSLPREEVRARLARAVGDDRGGAPDSERAAFGGRADGDGFFVTRVNRYRSAFLPSVKVRVVGATGGTAVELRMRPHRHVMLFLLIWLTFLLSATALLGLGGLEHKIFLLVPPLLLAALSLALSLLVFRSDCRWVADVFEEVLQEGKDPGDLSRDRDRQGGEEPEGRAWAEGAP